jgi:hypothetical protein
MRPFIWLDRAYNKRLRSVELLRVLIDPVVARIFLIGYPSFCERRSIARASERERNKAGKHHA